MQDGEVERSENPLDSQDGHRNEGDDENGTVGRNCPHPLSDPLREKHCFSQHADGKDEGEEEDPRFQPKGGGKPVDEAIPAGAGDSRA